MPAAAESHLTPLVAGDALIAQTLRGLVDAGQAPAGASRLLFSSAGRHIASHLLLRYSGRVPSLREWPLADWQVKRVVEFIDTRLDQNVAWTSQQPCWT